MKSKLKYIGIILIFTIFIMLIGGGIGKYSLGHDTPFHSANIKAILEDLSIKDLLVQKPVKLMAHDWGYGTRFFYPPLPHLMTAYIIKALGVFNIRYYTSRDENYPRNMLFCIGDIIFCLGL